MESTERYVMVKRRITTALQEAARRNGALAKPVVTSEEHRAKLRAAQQARREREGAERAALGIVAPEKKPPGRPRTRPVVEAGPKRGRGRPKKEDTSATV